MWRLDADVARPAEVLRAFEASDRGVLVGTQMVAKGHDFPDVTLGVVLDADATLRFPDFRAEERTFALVAQLAGRAGRGSAGGRVLVQTLDPTRRRSPPPRSTTPTGSWPASSSAGARCAIRRSRRWCGWCARRSSRAPPTPPPTAVRDRLELPFGAVLGPAPLFRLRGRERAQLVCKVAPDERAGAITDIGAAVEAVAAAKEHRAAAFSVDVDPQ